MTDLRPSNGIDAYVTRGIRLMVETTATDERRDHVGVMWALLREAVAVSRRYPGPPPSGLPGKSAMPDAPDEVTYWQGQNEAFRQKTTMQALYGKPAVPQFTAQQITDAAFTLDLFHRHALHGRRERVKLLRLVSDYAGGMPPRKIMARHGVSRWTLTRRKDQACEDMVAGLRRAQG